MNLNIKTNEAVVNATELEIITDIDDSIIPYVNHKDIPIV